MKKFIILPVTTILLFISIGANATIMNGNFENGNLDGWTASLNLWASQINDEGESINNGLYEFPFSINPDNSYPFAYEPSIETNHYYTPADGTQYIEIQGTNNELGIFDYLGVEYHSFGKGFVSLSQELSLEEGDILSGWAALYSFDYPEYDYDRAIIEVTNGLVSDIPLQITVKDAYGDDWESPDDLESASPWIHWSWTAPSAGLYTLSLINQMDSQETSIACFDGIQVYHKVPEPANMLLLGCSLFGLGALRKWV